MPKRIRFPFVSWQRGAGPVEMRPMLPSNLSVGSRSVSSLGLLDTGSSINILPFSLGHALGGDWAKSAVVPLGGVLGGVQGRAFAAVLDIPRLRSAQLAFAWIEDDRAPLILGQFNFFLNFDVCFYRLKEYLEIRASG